MELQTDIWFEPKHLSDFTLHFETNSFHLHTVILVKESGWFKAMIDSLDSESKVDDQSTDLPSTTSSLTSSQPINITPASSTNVRSCSLSEACSRANHRCFNLTDNAGNPSIRVSNNQSITLSDLNQFLDRLYNPSFWIKSMADRSLDTPHWRSCLSPYSKVLYNCTRTDQLTNHPAQTMSQHAPEWDIADVLARENDQVTITYHRGRPGGPKTATMSITSNRLQLCGENRNDVMLRDELQSFLSQHSQSMRIAHYFECVSMLDSYAVRCNQLKRSSIDMQRFEPLWELLVLAEEFQWNTMKESIITALSSDRQCTKRASWAASAAALNSRTLVRLIQNIFP